ncbi:MAG: class I SAM-dependent methyltransferase [Saprospiraceae bacterium]|nr:class I SAM-dependent methyltransferase [Saprospiraceae bacterium]
MPVSTLPEEKNNRQHSNMRQYYRWQSRIYDLTRWLFLFGRKRLLNRLSVRNDKDTFLTEIGCGTGYNLRYLASRYTRIQLQGMDVSADMLRRATTATASYSRRVYLLEKAYGKPEILKPIPDIILFSYALTMFNPGWEEAIRQAWADLPAGGRIAVVDFHDTPHPSFRWWMDKNHVRMEGHLLPLLEELFQEEYCEVRPAYLGWWQYMLFVGKKVI